MKKLVLMSLIVLGAAPAFAKVSSAAIVASQLNWRGLKLTTGPAVQGMTSYVHESGASAGLFVTNQDTYIGTTGNPAPNTSGTGYLMSPFLAYGMQMGDIGLSAMFQYYSFSPSASNRNAMEISLGANWMGAKFTVAYMPRTFQSNVTATGTDYSSSDLYFNLSYKAALEKDFGVLAAIGTTMFDKPANTQMSNYSDWKLALQHAAGDNTTFEIGYTDTIGLQKYATVGNDSSTKTDYAYTAQAYVSVTKAF